MTAKLRSWIIAGIIVLVIGFIVVWWFNGTGFDGYDKETKEYTPTGQLTKTTKESQPGKTVWDWLNLLGVLAIPVVVGFGAAWFTRTQQLRDREHEKLQRERDQEAARLQHDRDQQLADQRTEIERKAAEQQAELERELTRDNQREISLQAYIDKISELLLKEHLCELTADGKLNPEYDQVREIARVRTITVLTQLNVRRIGFVFAFLREAGLMSTTSDSSVVSLEGTDLRAVKWSQANLEGTDLRYANLFEADLSGANLRGAYLRGAYLRRADLTGAILSGAILSEAILSEAILSGADLRGTDLRYANLFEADLSKTDLRGAMGLTDEERADYRSRGALVDPIPSIPLSRSTVSPPTSSTPQRDGEQGQSPTPAQVAETPFSASDTTPPMQEEDGADANSSSAAPPTQPDSPS